MKEQFLTREQALELKELGFDEPCFTRFQTYFNTDKLQPIIATLGLNRPYENEYNGYDQAKINDTEKRWFFTGYKNSVKDHNENIISAPTYQQAFDFIREQFGYNYFIKSFGKDTYTFFIEKWKWKYYENDFKLPYEEARARCLDKLIEIINNDK